MPEIIINYWCSIGISLIAALAQWLVFWCVLEKDQSLHTLQIALIVMVSFSLIQRANFLLRNKFEAVQRLALIVIAKFVILVLALMQLLPGASLGDFMMPIPTFCLAILEAFLDYLEDLVSKEVETHRQMLTEKCTVKCVSNPGSVLSGSEKQCLQRCMDRFIESWDLVTKTLHGRLQQEMANSSSSSGMFSGNGGMGNGPSFS
uniref:Tim10-like domain-containing protein n=1 Tax=Ditylenchus dipsaci TaxID=166011 RepID=A0A915EL42_9BILA